MSPFLLNKNRKIMLFQVKQKSEARKLSGKRKPWVSTQLRDWIYRTTARSWVTTEPWPTASAASSWGNRTTAPAVIGLEWAGIRRWLPASLIFAPASNSGPIRESQICSPSQSHKMPSFLLGASSFHRPTRSNQSIPAACLFSRCLPESPPNSVKVADFLAVANSVLICWSLFLHSQWKGGREMWKGSFYV